MPPSNWVQDKIELGIDGELCVFKRANSPNYYMRVYLKKEGKHYQKSLRTASRIDAVDIAKKKFNELRDQIAKEEKIFSVTFVEALAGYWEQEKARERRGLIKNDWLVKKQSYLKNQFCHYFGEDIKVNGITDKKMAEYIDIRLKRCQRKETLKQEIVIIKHFYKNYLIKKGYVFKIPEMPDFRLNKNDKSRREDTFSVAEWEKLFKFMREWVKEKNVSRTRVAEKKYGKADNIQKLMREFEWQMECHRRVLTRELVLICGNLGLRAPSEVLSLTWRQVRVKREVFQGLYNSDKDVEQLVSIVTIDPNQKTGSRQVIGLAGAYFKRLKQYYRDKFDYEPQDDDPVFLEMVGRRKGSALCKYALYRLWGELMAASKLNRLDFTLYNLRGFYITQSILNGVDLTLISKNVGNSPSILLEHYEFVNMEKQMHQLIKRRDTRIERITDDEVIL